MCFSTSPTRRAGAGDAPPASVQLAYLFDDGGAGGNQGIPGTVTDPGVTTVTVTAVNDGGWQSPPTAAAQPLPFRSLKTPPPSPM